MGAGQIGGIATLLDIDFKNAAGFVGRTAEPTEAQFVVYFLSHAMMFCAGALLEAHVVLTPAICVFGEKYKFDVFAGTHDFLEFTGSPRSVIHVCIHRGFNQSLRGFAHCSHDNLAILVLDKQYSFNAREELTAYLINRVRYGIASTNPLHRNEDPTCAYFGWGSRRNGYMVPLLIRLQKVEAKLLPKDNCDEIWNYQNKFLCIYPQLCRSAKYGALCPVIMGAGQIGGIASLLDIDFKNAAGFIGNEAGNSEAQFVVYFLSHAMLFCAGALVEANIVLTPAACIFGERSKFEVFGGTHDFIEHSGSPRTAVHVCVHKGYNRTLRGYNVCALDNVAILVLEKQFHFDRREPGASFIINRVRYGIASKEACHRKDDPTCAYFGWGSRRNGYMLPLLLHLFKVEAKILPKHQCENVWHHDNKYLCLYPHMCKDDVGSVLVCSGFLQGLMATRLVDRPCGVGWLDMVNYIKFLTCAVDDAQDLVKLDKETILMEIPTNPIISVTRKPTETEPPEPREL